MARAAAVLRAAVVGGIIHRNAGFAANLGNHLANGHQLPFASNPSGGAMAEAVEQHEELVKIFDTEEESEAMVVRGLLESAGIDAIIQNREAPQDILPGVGGVVVLVRPDQAEDARQTIEAYRSSPTTDADEAVSEEPAPQ
jgi:Putative prokaryotic signal transducing protein